MGTFGDSVCSDESQCSQVLNNAVLGGSMAGPLPRNPLPPGNFLPREDPSQPSARHSQLSYHFHGLAPTQSQSQPKDVSLFREESQKENTPASTSPHFTVFRQPEATLAATTGGAQNALEIITEDAAMEDVAASNVLSNRGRPCDTSAANAANPVACSSRRDNASNALSAKARDKQAPPRANNRRKRRRSPSMMSEDSFAGALPPDLEQKKYMKETKVFQVPLSQLDASQESAVDDTRSDNEKITKTAGPSSPIPLRTRFRELSVSRTSSQPHPEPPLFDPSQPRDHPNSYPQAQEEDDDDFFPPPRQLRPLYDDSDDMERYPLPDTQGEQSEPESLADSFATQITQPSTPEHTQPAEEDDIPPPSHDGYPQQSGAASTTTGGTLLDLVNPDKEWRFGEDKDALLRARANDRRPKLDENRQEAAAYLGNWEETQPSDASNRPATGQANGNPANEDLYEETQPSESSKRPATGHVQDEEERDESFEATQPTPASNLPATGYTTDPSSSMQAVAPSSPPQLHQSHDSDMDVIADSEPTQPHPVHDETSPVIPHPDTTSARPASDDAAMQSREDALEDTDDASEDIPLALLTATRPASNAKSAMSDPIQRDASGLLMPPPRKRTRTEPLPAPQVASLFSEDDVIPSSDPQERLLEAPAQAPKVPRTTRGKATKAATLPPVTPGRSHGRDDQEPDNETTINGNGLGAAPDSEDVCTELADDESEQLADRGSTSRKRKRMPSSSVKGSARSLRTNNTYTPPVKSAKRLKSVSIARSSSASATRVLALWRQDSYYYVGTVYSEADPQRYMVKFDDGEQDTLDLSRLRRCEFRKGDNVMVLAEPKPLKAVVVDASRVLTDRTVLLSLEDDEELEITTNQLLIPSRTIVSKWADRMLTADEIVTVVKPQSSPTPSKSVDINSWSKSTRGIFHKVGFVTTMSPGQDNWEREKRNLQATIKDNGGVDIDDWCQVFKMDGTLSLQNKRWVLTKNEITLLRKELDRVFLLADDANHKPKFLIALALGVPCVKLDWLWDSATDMSEREWHSYLLHAGTSEILGARFTQMVDADWGDSPEHIRDVANNTVPSKLFADKNILCISPDFVQAKTNKRGNSDNERAREATRMIPRIILCMGAERVEAVGTFASASSSLQNYDYIVFRESEEAKKAAKARDLGSCVPFCWVKECLITGRLLPRD